MSRDCSRSGRKYVQGEGPPPGRAHMGTALCRLWRASNYRPSHDKVCSRRKLGPAAARF